MRAYALGGAPAVDGDDMDAEKAGGGEVTRRRKALLEQWR